MDRQRKILVADDEPAIRELLGEILARAGYEVVFAEDGKSAVEKASTEKPDLVLLDGLMPKMHGFLASKAIKELNAPPKVILLTAVYTKPTYKWEVKAKHDADDLLTKPFNIGDLLACLEKHLSDFTQNADEMNSCWQGEQSSNTTAPRDADKATSFKAPTGKV